MSDIDEPFHYRKRSQKQKQRFDSSNVGVASAASAALLITATGCTLSGSNSAVSSRSPGKIVVQNEKDKKVDQQMSSRRISLWDEQPQTSSTGMNSKFLEPSTSQNIHLNVPQTPYLAQTISAPVTPQNNSRGPSPSVYSSFNVVVNNNLEKRRRGSLSSPLLNFSRELKELRKRSISEISLILEIIRGATHSDQSNRSRRNTKFNIGDRRSSLSTGNLILRGSSSTEINNNFTSSPSLSQISSFIRHKGSTKMRWQQRLSPNNIQKQMGIGRIFLTIFLL